MFRMFGVFEVFLQVNERARRLDQSFEVLRVLGLRLQPEMLEHIMGFIITLLVPATKEAAITWVFGDVLRIRVRRASLQLLHET